MSNLLFTASPFGKLKKSKDDIIQKSVEKLSPNPSTAALKYMKNANKL